MASLKFRHYATESDLRGTGTIQAALNAFDVGTIVFIDSTQKQYIITSKTNNVVTYKIYYGEPAVVSVSGSGAARTLTWSDGREETVTINDVAHATLADVSNTTKSVAWGNITEKPNIVTTDTEQTISGSKIFNNNTTFHNETDMESLTTDSLLVTGSARFTNTINGNLKGDVEGNLTGNISGSSTSCSGNSATATKLTNLSSADTASASATWRKVWFSYNDGVTGRPSLSDSFAYQTSTNTLKVPNLALSGNATINGAIAVTGKASFNGGLTGTLTGNLIGNADTATTASSCSGNSATATNADKLGNLNADNYFKHRDAAFNSEWSGKYLWTLWDNHLYAATKRFDVTLTGTTSTNFDALFDGSFESQITITEPQAVLNIRSTTKGNVWTTGLPYGDFYVVFYNSDAENITGRVYCNYASQGTGWHDLTVTHIGPHIWKLHNGYYQLSDLEITITKPESSTSINLCQIIHVVERPAGPGLAAAMSKYCDQKTNYNIEAAKFIGPLQGNADTATTATTASSCSGNSATATKAGYLDAGTMTLYAHNNNEINFGGTYNSSTIYFGYRATESKPTPTSFIFGGHTGTATLTANGFKKKDSDASYVLTGDGGHALISGLSVNYATSSGACTGNAGTATKLETARTLWGQSFDGSKNISGNISNTGNIIPSVTKTSDLGSNALSYRYVYTTWVGAPGNTKLSLGGSNATHLTIDTSGNVGIGITSPTSKLHVAGAGYFTGDTSSATNIIAGGYIKGETVKISSGCTLEYDSTQKCVKFVFS